MNILLDTHVILWALTDSEHLTESVRNLLEDARNELYISVASIWEIAIKKAKRPSAFPFDAEQVLSYVKKAGYRILSIEPPEAIIAPNLSTNDQSVHQDPFDRILLAQATTRSMKLLTHDVSLRSYEEECVILF